MLPALMNDDMYQVLCSESGPSISAVSGKSRNFPDWIGHRFRLSWFAYCKSKVVGQTRQNIILYERSRQTRDLARAHTVDHVVSPKQVPSDSRGNP